MRTLYATKPDTCGNTYILVIDTNKKQYSNMNTGFFHRSDAVTVTKKKLHELEAAAIAEGYTATSAL